MYKNIEGYSDPTMGAVMRIMMTEYNDEKRNCHNRIRTMAINKVVYGTTVLVDLTNDTVRPESMLLGTRAHACNGDMIEGTLNGSQTGLLVQIEGVTPAYISAKSVTIDLSEFTALQFISLFEESDDFELIWVRNSGTNRAIPEGYEFIGYDISYPCDYSGSFSIICDCMFICRWHGCDKEGILFLPEFSKLNANGLFDDWQSAYDYMVKYLSEDWTERGEYCILEIFKKLGR